MVSSCPNHLRRIFYGMIKRYRTVSELFSVEVELDLETNYRIITVLDIPMEVEIEYRKDSNVWHCECRFKPMTNEVLAITREYTTELINNIMLKNGQL